MALRLLALLLLAWEGAGAMRRPIGSQASQARPQLAARAAASRRRTAHPLRMVQRVKSPYSTKSYLESTLAVRTMTAQWIYNGVPRWITLLDEALFVVASALFIWGSYGFIPGSSIEEYIDGCELFIVGSVLLFGLALFGLYEIFEDAKLAGDTPQIIDLAEQALYLLGSLLFLVGTIYFTPALPDYSPDFSIRALLGSFVPPLAEGAKLPPPAMITPEAVAPLSSAWWRTLPYLRELLAPLEVKSGQVSALPPPCPHPIPPYPTLPPPYPHPTLLYPTLPYSTPP